MKSNIYLSILFVFVLAIFSTTLKAQYISPYDANGHIKSVKQREFEKAQMAQKALIAKKAKEIAKAMDSQNGQMAPKFQNTIKIEDRYVGCILPTSICVITEVKNAADNIYVGKQIEIQSPFYSFDNEWYTMGIAALPNDEGFIRLAGFKYRLISQPVLPTYPACLADAEIPTKLFSFIEDEEQVQILALGAIDKQKYPVAENYIGKIFKTNGMVMPIGNCWYSGWMVRDNKLFFFPCVQLKVIE